MIQSMKVRLVTVHITVSLNNALEVRAPYVATELCNPICVYVYMVNAPRAAPRRPRVQWRPRVHSLLSATMQTGRSIESSQIQDCSSGKLSKAFHTSTATVTAVRRELCFRKAKKNHNHNNWGEPEQAPH